MSASMEIWGFRVSVSASGRINWPNELKRMATKRVLDGHERIALIASEIGAHENLVRKWCIQERRSRGEDVSRQPLFAPVTIVSPDHEEPSTRPAMCRLTVGQAVLEFPVDAPPENLRQVIEAMKGAL
ncbi:transposase [Tropicibacter oceani]|uniref:Transposase n=1 Tax=Tropicibacter oceani TaxID=3058420 RepID=A0ABY8QG75_9RHOB|nr:transposase [Tropicibacter oceani]WGW03622.1 transposase [Tropicibacter oceani]